MVVNFEDLGLSDAVMKALGDLGFSQPTKIQNEIIPPLLQTKGDVIGLAHTGTGKTLAYAIPLIENCDLSIRYLQCVIMAPTRELAKQITRAIKDLGKYHKALKVDLAYGGIPIVDQAKKLIHPPHILVATPGRLIDLIERNILYVKDLSTIVLDEADEMLRMGFREEVDKLLREAPESAQIWLFSATFPKNVRQLSNHYLQDPLVVESHSVKSVNKDIEHNYLLIKPKEKFAGLTSLLNTIPESKGIIFCRTKQNVRVLQRRMQRLNKAVLVIHGDLYQIKRESAIRQFNQAKRIWLIATDIAARGLDLKDIDYIIHYDFPENFVQYTHRSGRTARAGETGISILLVTKDQLGMLSLMQESLKIQIDKMNL
jgi:ATP-dependent RNA helicase DeaD